MNRLRRPSKFNENSKHKTLYDYLLEQETKKKIVEEFNLDDLTQSAFGAMMNDDNIPEESKKRIADAVQQAGGYECLAQMD